MVEWASSVGLDAVTDAGMRRCAAWVRRSRERHSARRFFVIDAKPFTWTVTTDMSKLIDNSMK